MSRFGSDWQRAASESSDLTAQPLPAVQRLAGGDGGVERKIMRLAGIPVSLLAMGQLSTHLQEVGERALSRKISDAIAAGATDIALSLQERVRLLGALEDPPRGLGPLREALIGQFKERERRATGDVGTEGSAA